MKNFFYFCVLLLCTPFVSLAQSNVWDPFPLHQKSWWRVGNELQMFYQDSTSVELTGQKHYFGAKYFKSPFDACFEDIVIQKPSADYPLPAYYFQGLTSDGEKWYAGKELIFSSNSKPGDAWDYFLPTSSLFNSVRLVHVADDSMEIFKEKMAVRRFRFRTLLDGQSVAHPLDNQEMIWAEKIGFVRLIPYFFPADAKDLKIWELKGIQQNNSDKGLVPSWELFLGHYKPGQLYKWKEYEFSIHTNGLINREIHLDSIVKVDYAPDFLGLVSFRRTLLVRSKKNASGEVPVDSTYTITPEHKWGIDLKQVKQTFKVTPNWFFSVEAQSSPEPFGQSFFSFGDDGCVHVRERIPALGINRGECEAFVWLDAGSDRYFHECCGYAGYGETGFSGSFQLDLVGCRIGNKVVGDITPPKTLAAPEPRAGVYALGVRPSLTSDQEVMLDLPSTLDLEGNKVLEIRSLDGRLVMRRAAFDPSASLDLSPLGKGQYVVSIKTAKAILIGKVTVMR